ncbi:MAG: hypothetical protein KAT58_05190 [candidate division Zixibacteria bacterium]|nr:hypothetical protein [candidate division Zixibacteria bacterium]
MSSSKSKYPDQAERLDDISEGVDVIGTMIDESLPAMVQSMSHLQERVEEIAEQIGERSDADSLAGDELSDRLELIEQRFLAFEQAVHERFGDLSEDMRELQESLSELHGKIDTLAAAAESLSQK